MNLVYVLGWITMFSSKQRVISSGLDSIKSKDAQWISELFFLMGCFAEVEREDIVVNYHSVCIIMVARTK